MYNNNLSAKEQLDRARARFEALKVGDHVPVHRYGREYDGVVVSLGRVRAKVHFVYGNGAERNIYLEWRDLL